MIVGLPGAGISAFFYLFGVLLMPLRVAYLLARRRPLVPGTISLVTRQWLIAAGIVAAFWVTGMALGVLLPPTAPAASAGGGSTLSEPLDRVLARVGVWFGLGTLALVLLVIQVLAGLEGRRRPRPGQVSAPRSAPLIVTIPGPRAQGIRESHPGAVATSLPAARRRAEAQGHGSPVLTESRERA